MSEIKKWLIAAGIRAAKTAAEGALIVIGTNTMFISEVNWLAVLSGAAIGAITSLLISIKGIPEVADGASVIQMVKEGE